MSLASTGEVLERKFGVAEVKKMLNVSSTTVHRMIQRGELKAYRIGNTFQIPMSSLREVVGDGLVEPLGECKW